MPRRTNELPVPRREWLSDLAESIASRYASNVAIDIERIAREYRITHSIGDYGDAFDGLLEYHNGRFHIYLNNRQSDLRMRFSYAHELAHYFIDEHCNALASGLAPAHSSYTGFAEENFVEKEADLFAACLLMPKQSVTNDYRKHRKFTWSIVTDLSQKYQVSTLAAVYRLQFLDLHPFIVVKGIEGMIDSFWKTKDFYFYLDLSSGIPEDSMMYEYFANGQKINRTAELYAPDWFSTDKETPIYEHCIYYDYKNTCYSVIWQD